MKQKNLFAAKLQEKFNIDVSETSEFVDMTSDELWSNLVETSNLLDKLFIDEGVKNKKILKINRNTLTLGDFTECEPGGNIDLDFAEVILDTVPIGVNEVLCMQDFEVKWTTMFQASGLKNSLKTLPKERQLEAVLVALLKKKIQDLIIKGDTGSLNPELALLDGLVTQWNADVNLVSVPLPPFNATNAVSNFAAMYDAIPNQVLDSGTNIEIWTSVANVNNLIDEVYNTKDFASSSLVTRVGAMVSVQHPTRPISIVSYPQFTGNQAYCVPTDYIVVGTDAADELSGLEVTYLEESLKVRILGGMRLDVKYVFSEYFVKWTLATS